MIICSRCKLTYLPPQHTQRPCWLPPPPAPRLPARREQAAPLRAPPSSSPRHGTGGASRGGAGRGGGEGRRRPSFRSGGGERRGGEGRKRGKRRGWEKRGKLEFSVGVATCRVYGVDGVDAAVALLEPAWRKRGKTVKQKCLSNSVSVHL